MTEHPDHSSHPKCAVDRVSVREVRDVDDFLVWLMPNLTVIRRYVMGSWLLKFLLVIVVILVIGRVNDNTNRAQEAVCPVIEYAEKQGDIAAAGDPTATPPRAPNPAAAEQLYKLAASMRQTGVHCPPRSHDPAIPPKSG